MFIYTHDCIYKTQVAAHCRNNQLLSWQLLTAAAEKYSSYYLPLSRTEILEKQHMFLGGVSSESCSQGYICASAVPGLGTGSQLLFFLTAYTYDYSDAGWIRKTNSLQNFNIKFSFQINFFFNFKLHCKRNFYTFKDWDV